MTTPMRRPRTKWQKLSLTGKASFAFIAFIAFVGILSRWLLTHDPTAPGLAAPSTGPGTQFWFGVDRLGRDVFSRLVAGTPRSLVVGFGSTAIGLVVGGVLGALAATSRRLVDEAIMRFLDVVMAFPPIVLAALLVVSYGKDSLLVLVATIGLVFAPQFARIVRANISEQYTEDYVAAEKIIGATRSYILIRHVIRNCAAPILVFATFTVANAIVFEAGLSFIGAGVQPQAPQSSWGSVIAYGQQLLASRGWWATFFPGLLILVTVLALNLLAEGISDVWAAPTTGRVVPGRGAANTSSPEVPASGKIVELPGISLAARRIAATARPEPTAEPILTVTDLRIAFGARHGAVDIVDTISFSVRPGEILGLVGESGCGKSLTALTVMGLQPSTADVSGSVNFDGQDLLPLSRRGRRRLMGREIAMIYQDALSALNPSMTVGAQIRQLTRRGGTRTPGDLMRMVGLEPRRTLAAYPHELSGGQRQRVVIALALSRDPKLVIADEPTTALDVTVQAQIMDLILRLSRELGFALILVSHDLALLSSLVDRVAVMYGGQFAETGAVAEVLAAPAHHYSRGLLGAVLSLENQAERLTQIPGVVPSPADFPRGCRFADRCPAATALCHEVKPSLDGTHRHRVACHHPVGRIEASNVLIEGKAI